MHVAAKAHSSSNSNSDLTPLKVDYHFNELVLMCSFNMFIFCSFSTSAVKYGQCALPTIIFFHVTLHILFPHDDLVAQPFQLFDNIQEWLKPKHFLVDSSGNSIYYQEVNKINLSTVYRIVGPGLSVQEKGLSRDQVWDKVFEKKVFLAVKDVLEEMDPGVTELSRVLVDDQGKDIAEWEAVFEMPDGCIIFLEAKYHMTHVCIYSIYHILLTKQLKGTC